MADLTYPEAGGTARPALPAGYSHLRVRTNLGHVRLAGAAEALFTWRMHRAIPVGVTTTAPRAVPGAELTVHLGPISAPCRVVWTVEEESRAGWAYGTLPGHPERGEEAFWLEEAGDGQVWLTVIAFSQPAAWYARMVKPVVPLFQNLYARRCGVVLRRLARSRPHGRTGPAGRPR
ncbi:DUF1990 family protein [Longispora albida]|uniref:DUF1990 family protein n=1 Tax=Longispora albida TaxID=203523 RepID=UPI0003671ABB|nr:DUF1990 domain-containing protein [Longispora albida]